MTKKKAANRDRPSSPPKPPIKKQVTIDRRIPVGQSAVFSNHMVVQSEPAVFHLLFFQIHHPLLVIDDPELLRQELAKIESIEAECVSRIVVPVNLMPGIINALQDNFAKHQAKASEIVAAGSQSEAKGKDA